MIEITVKLNKSLNHFNNENWSTAPGCYILYRENGPVPRIGGLDPKGILYIGKGDSILRRVKSLRDSVICNASHDQTECVIKGHNALSQKFYRMRKHITVENLSIRIFQLPKNIQSSYLESYLLEEYASQFGELPPLNGSYGSHYFEDAVNNLNENNIDLPSL
ncbi:hypothetical protein K8089_10040 [Aequorivita sp. F47161]|uniref:GIY-YIG domain-containing protein n=1 Tax=Aequorivita vitellina TaxID=2874475 RepID=A0A9X1QUZ7_9FLAO|nr:hypothetical protein [Aequorivita vitellina]MCG2419363.1 hypothetical protein [Aequorivita vitellina]